MDLKTHQEDRGKEGVYDKRNKLNNLSGKQWQFSTRSVITKYYESIYNSNYLNSNNISLWTPALLIRDLIKTFSKPNSLIIDPLCNFGSCGIATYLASEHRKFIGWEYNRDISSIDQLLTDQKIAKKVITQDSQIKFQTNNVFKSNLENIRPQFLFTELIYNTKDIHNSKSLFNQWRKKITDIMNLYINTMDFGRYAAIVVQNTIERNEIESNRTSINYIYNTNIIASDLSKMGWYLKGEIIFPTKIGKILIKSIEKSVVYPLRIKDSRILIFRAEIHG